MIIMITRLGWNIFSSTTSKTSFLQRQTVGTAPHIPLASKILEYMVTAASIFNIEWIIFATISQMARRRPR